MKNKILYVELKTGYHDNGPDWIGKSTYSKSGRTVYFDGRALSKTKQGISANHIDIETGEEYWVSGIKKSQKDRHWAGNGKVQIDKNCINEYLELIGAERIDMKRFQIVELDNSDITGRIFDLENKKLNE